MSDLISRQAAIDALERAKQNIHHNIERAIGDAVCGILDEVENGIKQLPPIQPNLLQPWEILAAQSVLSLPEPHWIPVEQALPEEPFGCLVTVWDTNPVTMDEFENILPYFVGWDGEQWNDGDGQQCPFEVIAWMPLPEPYKEVTE